MRMCDYTIVMGYLQRARVQFPPFALLYRGFKMKRKSILFVALLFVFLCVGVILFSLIRFRGSKVITVSEEAVDIIPCEDITHFRQDDERWAEEKLGSSVYSMKKSGCLVTCIASALSMERKTVTPGSLNEQFSSGSVYDKEGNLHWENLRQLDSGESFEVEVYNTVSEEILQDCLKQGKFLIVRVRMSGIGNFHYVLIVKFEEGKYFCMDPLEDQLQPLSHYGNRVYAIKCVSAID